MAGRSSVSDRVWRQSILSPILICCAERSMSSRQATSSIERDIYFSISPEDVSVPTSSPSVRRRRVMWPESLMMRSNCSTDSMNFTTASWSSSFGSMRPRQSVEKLLCCRALSRVVLVRNR